MTDPETIEFVVNVTSTIVVIEVVVLIVLIFRLYKTLPRPSRLPLIMTGSVAIGVAGYAVATGLNIMPVVLSPVSVSIVRSLLMLLMSLPIWIILAMYDTRCEDCPNRKESPNDS